MPARRYIVSPQGAGPPQINFAQNGVIFAELTFPTSFQFTGAFGQAPYTWAVVSGGFPAGTALSSSGLLSGTPTAGGIATAQIQITDARSAKSVVVTVRVNVLAAVRITTASTLPAATQGVSYSVTLASSGGLAPYTYADTGGTLDPGLAVTVGGVIQGVPTTSNTYAPVITVTDALGNSAPFTFSLTVVASGTAVWPQMAAYNISAGNGVNSYNNPNQVTYMQHLNTTITGCYDSWESFGIAYDGTHNGSMHAFTQAVQSGSKQPGGTILLADYDAQVLNPNICTTNQVSNNMDLLTTYPGGSHVMQGSNHIGNICTVGPQPTFGGRNSNTYNADYLFDYTVDAGALGLAGNPVSANSTLNGFYLDDTSPYVRFAGDYLRNGTTQSADTTGSTPASLALKSAYGTIANRLRSDKPGALIFGNFSGLYVSGVDLTNFTGVFDGGNAEHITGWVNSLDVTNDWFAMMALLTKQKNALKSDGTLLFGHDNVLNNGADFYRTAPGQAWRYGLASAMMAQSQWAPNPSGPQPNMTPNNGSGGSSGDYAAQDFGSWLWPDEMAVDPTTLIAYPYGSANITLGTGWYGTEIDVGIITTLWQGTIVRKRYQMTGGRQLWIMINTSRTTAATATYGQRMQAFSGTQVPSINSGNTNITVESIPAWDARFRITFP